MYESKMSFRSLPQSYVLISTTFSIMDVTENLLNDLSIEREQLMKMKVNELPRNGKVTPVFNEQGNLDYLLYELISPESLNKMRTDFISTASHELRTPVTALKLQVQLAKKFIESHSQTALTPTKVKKFIDRASKDVSKLSQLVDDMLEVSTSKHVDKHLQVSWFNLEDFIEDFKAKALDSFLNFNERVVVNVDAPEMVLWDPLRIEQVLFNLIRNSYRYGNESPISLSVTSGGGYVYISVEDSGPGISKEDQKRIFNMFERGNSLSQCGLGLGLYVCKEIVSAHAGNIFLKSSTSKQTVFQVRLPLKAEDRI